MLLNNPLQINDWKFSRFIKLIIIVQLLTLFLVGLNLKGITIPIITQLTGFIYLTVIPGFLILRILKIHQIGSVKSLLYAVGLSIVSVMFLGFIVDMVLPFVGIYNPLSIIPITLAVSLYVLILSIISYIRDKDFNDPSLIDTKDLLSPVFIFLCLIPFMAIFGSYTMNLYHNNIISMILLVLIAVIFILVVSNIIPPKLYLFAIWIVSISLLYMSSLISPFIWGWDIQNEYYLANLVLNYSYWNYMLPDAYNSMLSIVMLGPVYSMVTSLSLDYVLKIIFPFILSLVSVGLYKIFKTQTNNSKIAFMSVFLFISFNTFYIELVSITREITAELFLILLLLLFLDRKFKPNLLVLMIAFTMGLVVSHYSTTYFFIAAFIGVTLMLAIFNLSNFHLSRDKVGFKGNKTLLFLLPSITTFMILFAYIWYGSFSQGLAIKSIIDVLTYIKQDLFDTLNLWIWKIGLVPSTTIYILLIILLIIIALIIIYLIKISQKRFQSSEHHWMSSIQNKIQDKLNYKVIAVISIVVLVVLSFFVGPYKTWIVTVLRYLNFAVVFFSLLGMALIFLNIHKNKFQNTFLAFSIVGAVMLITGFLVPAFEGSFNISRIYELSFLILSPFCVIGGMKALGSIYGILKREKIGDEKSLKLFSIFLIIFLLFNTGFVSVLANQSIPMHLSNQERLSDYYPLFDQQESTSAKWLINHNITSNIYTDVYGKFIFYRFTPNINEISSNNGISEFTPYNANNTYMYLRKLNTENSYLVGFTSRTDRNRVYADLSSVVNIKNRIFDDGDSRVYYR
jgi:uncharacterized membrane protein